jgi:uncharacterized protein (DUF1499 family)
MRVVGLILSAVVSPAGAVAAVSLALCLLALAPLSWRLGWWPLGFALYRIFPAAGVMGAIAAAIALATLAKVGAQPGRRALVLLLAVLAVGACLAAMPLRYSYLSAALPPINDIATDTDDRPAFEATRAARAAASADRIDTPEPRRSRLQIAGYPDIAPLRTPLPVSEAFRAALAVAQAMAGWSIVAVDRDKRCIEASEHSRWFGFADDIVIRVTGDRGGSRIDVRSASRRGRRDYGANAARIRAYLRALTKAVGQ